jgi:predicted acetyltransferase
VSPRPERLTIRPLTPDDDLEPEIALAQQAFGPVSAAEREQRRAAFALTVAGGRYLGAFDGGALVASARYFDMRQWWHGRPLPMAGVAGVKVAPHEQGRGLGRVLMTALLRQMAERGYPLSALYPATAPLYRSLGWELAGGRYEATIPARSLRRLQPPDPAAGSQDPAGSASPAGPGLAGSPGASLAHLSAAGSVSLGSAGSSAVGAASQPDPGRAPAEPVFRPAGAADAAEMIAVLGRLYSASSASGPVTFDVPQLAASLGDEDYVYLAPDGVLSYRWHLAADALFVNCAAAGSAATTRALWSIVSSHGTIASNVQAVVGPADPVTWLTAEPDVTLTRAEQWMLRLLDAPAAIAGRGFPAGVSLSVPLTVTDPQLPGNAGDWRLEVSGGAAALTPARPGSTGPGVAGSQSPRPHSAAASAGPDSAGSDSAGSGAREPGSARPESARPDSARPDSARPLQLGARGLAALYAGTPLATLRRAGLAAGGTPDADAALDAAFAATPYMTDSF